MEFHKVQDSESSMRYFLGAALVLAFVLAGCASSKRVVVDPQGVNQAQYEHDLAECRAITGQVSTGRDTAEGAVGGAVYGGLIGAIFGGSRGAARGAGTGAVVGGGSKAQQAEKEKSRVVKNCMRGRGYRVLN
ncbi:MAG TPA: hypothetical protein VK110_09825 [Salinisphaeraceae bacterium]|nr:hypothetical protein [Salinisphaeraceae bacterium]